MDIGDAAKKFVTLLLAAITLQSCDPLPGTMRSKARAIVRNELLDPEAAQFRDDEVSTSGKSVCGQVNTKNRMGGYVGFIKYVAMPDVGKALIADDPDFGEYYRDINNELSLKAAGEKIVLTCTLANLWQTVCPEPMRQLAAEGARQCKLWSSKTPGDEDKLKTELGITE